MNFAAGARVRVSAPKKSVNHVCAEFDRSLSIIAFHRSRRS